MNDWGDVTEVDNTPLFTDVDVEADFEPPYFVCMSLDQWQAIYKELSSSYVGPEIQELLNMIGELK